MLSFVLVIIGVITAYFGSRYQLRLVYSAYVNLLVVLGLQVFMGNARITNLSHSAFMGIGAYAAAAIAAATGNFYIGLLLAVPVTFASGYLLEFLLIRHLYRRDHMEQVLATFGLILFFNELIRIGFGPAALYSDLPPSLSGFVEILPGTSRLLWFHLVADTTT